jgi:DNA-binding MarR family transcriptional regulator
MSLAKRGLRHGSARLSSTSCPTLLVDGSDASFRVFIQGFFSVAGRLELIRERVGAMYGISGAQFGILMGIRQLEGRRGVSLNGLAELLHQRGTFITSQTNRLRERGLIYKEPNPDDRRGVLLRLAPPGRALIEEMLPLVASLNDRIFEGLDAEDFALLRRAVAVLVDSTDDALTIVERVAKRMQTIGA